MKLSLENCSVKQKNIFGFMAFCISMLIIVLFLFFCISSSLDSNSLSIELFPLMYFGIAGLYLINDFLMHKSFGIVIPNDYFFKLGRSQKYALPLLITFTFLVFKTEIGSILFS